MTNAMPPIGIPTAAMVLYTVVLYVGTDMYLGGEKKDGRGPVTTRRRRKGRAGLCWKTGALKCERALFSRTR